MKVLEHRRHSQRADRSIAMSHLTQYGLNLAKSVDTLFDSYDLVVTSTLQRAVETAVGMGHAISFTDARLNTYGQEIENLVDYLLSFEIIATFLVDSQPFQKFAAEQLSFYQEIIDRLPTDGRALIISHGGVIDIPLVAIFPDENHGVWGDIPFEYCEGFRIYYDDQEKKFVRYELLRISES